MPSPFAPMAAAAVFAASLSAQCPPTAVPGLGIPGTDDFVRTQILWDPDGPGPASEVLVVGGSFEHAGAVASRLLATYDPQTGSWSSLPNTQLTGTDVRDLAVAPNGDLIVCGTFGVQGAPAVTNIARFDGQTWSPLGQLPSFLNAVAVLPNGDVLAGGTFQLSGPAADSTIARWNGSSWSSFGQCSGTATTIEDLLVTSAGDVLVGGSFTSVDGVPAEQVARWDGSSWAPISSGANGRVMALAERANGDLLVGGLFTSFDGQPAGLLVEQNGAGWTPLFPAPPFAATGVTAIAPLPAGGVAAVGGAGTFAGNSFGIYNGSDWTYPGALTSPGGSPSMMATIVRLADGSLVAGGRIQDVGDLPCANVVRYQPTTDTWSTLGAGTNARVRALLRTSAGELYAGGDFTSLDGHAIRYLARRTATGWEQVTPAPSGSVATLAEAANGDLLVGGSFQQIGNVQANRIARWDGATWQPLGAGSALEVSRIVALPNGEVAAWGRFGSGFGLANLARWNGSTWIAFGDGDPITNSSATIADLDDAIGSLSNGDLVVAAITANPSAFQPLRWDGAAWTAVAPPTPTPVIYQDMVVLPGDQLIWGDQYWNGSSWQPSNTARAYAAAARPDGQTWLATALPDETSRIAAGPNGAWSNLLAANGTIRVLVADDDGTLWAAGEMRDFGGQGSAYLARVETPCPAAVAAAGPGCQSSLGPLTQTATQPAWVGGSAVAETSDLPPGSIALYAMGFQQQALPLANVLPQAAPGCTLWHSADLLLLPFVVPGPIAYVIQVPAAPALAGSDYRTQVALFELDGNGAIQSVSTSNALRWTIGSFQ